MIYEQILDAVYLVSDCIGIVVLGFDVLTFLQDRSVYY